MPSWTEVLGELQDSPFKNALDVTRVNYIQKFAKLRDRHVICYYSGWLQKSGFSKCSIIDDDKNSFMATIHKLDRSKGLDLILHTPGGDMAATESIIDYLHRMFDGNIEVFIPQLAMSGGTMIACSSRKIWMGKQSNIGPIDPQFGGIPAHGVIKEFEQAIKETSLDPLAIPMWQAIIGKYHPTFLGECRNAIDLAGEMVKHKLVNVMFAGDQDADQKADKVVSYLNEHDNTKTHARHIHIDEAENCGLIIEKFEDHPDIQDLVLTIHHCYIHTFSLTGCLKIVENDLENRIITFDQPSQN